MRSTSRHLKKLQVSRSRDINDLTPQMAAKARLFKEKCAEAGVKVLIYATFGSLESQARLYRQGRTYFKIKDKIYSLRKRGFGFLADIIESVGPQSGNKIVTWAGPGESWHNLKEAFDAVPLADVDGDGDLDALWNDEKYAEQWQIMYRIGIELGLTVGGLWKRKDGPHFQLRKGSNPTRAYKPQQLKEIFIQNGLLSE